MRIHRAPMFPLHRVVIFQNAVQVADGHVDDLVYVEGDDSFVGIFLHPDAIPAFEAKWFPKATGRTLS